VLEGTEDQINRCSFENSISSSFIERYSITWLLLIDTIHHNATSKYIHSK
jgi:hypothetical protein